MIALNLVNSEKSDIAYRISQFPDGQQTVDLVEWSKLSTSTDGIRVTSRLNSFKDLELIICAVQAIRNLASTIEITLYVPYFVGARSDRKFAQGGVNYLKQVICPIINSLNLNKVVVLDPHSDVLEACLNNYEKINNHLLAKYALADIDTNMDVSELCLVSPDAGAYKKIFDVAKLFGIENVITATKVRDMKTGTILRTEIPTLDQHKELKYVIIDDICDGGRTFIELAKAIKDSRPSAKVYLVVTHGIFSAGFSDLNKLFEGIYCTNSYREIADDEYGEKTRATTFNIF